MKNSLCIYCMLIISGMFISTSMNAQNILAGQIEGEYIHHFDIEDIPFGAFQNQQVWYDLHINGFEGFIEFFAYYWVDGPYENKGVNITPNSGLRVSTEETVYDFDVVRQHETGDTIGAELHWSSDMSMIYSSNYSLNNWFIGDGYIGFELIEEDTIYGWIRVHTQLNYCIIYEYAFYSESYVGVEKVDKQNVIISPNPVVDKLSIKIDQKEAMYSIFNAQGRLMDRNTLSQGNNLIDVQHFSDGLYFIHFEGDSQAIKILKR